MGRAVKTDERVGRSVRFLRDALPELVAIYVYGSWGTAEQRPGSDLDIAVLNDVPIDPTRTWDLAQSLARKVGVSVDLVDLSAASVVLRAQVIAKGERIYCSNAPVCDQFENLTYSGYARLNEERRGILEDIRKRGSIYG